MAGLYEDEAAKCWKELDFLVNAAGIPSAEALGISRDSDDDQGGVQDSFNP